MYEVFLSQHVFIFKRQLQLHVVKDKVISHKYYKIILDIVHYTT